MKALDPPAAAYALKFVPGDADIDENGHVNNVVYLRWAQDIAIAHWRSRVPADEQARQAWVVLRHEVDYRRPLLPGETATARTWVGEASGPRFIRYVRIDGPDGAMCAQTASTWVLVDPVSKRPMRIKDDLVALFAPDGAIKAQGSSSAD